MARAAPSVLGLLAHEVLGEVVVPGVEGAGREDEPTILGRLAAPPTPGGDDPE